MGLGLGISFHIVSKKQETSAPEETKVLTTVSVLVHLRNQENGQGEATGLAEVPLKHQGSMLMSLESRGCGGIRHAESRRSIAYLAFL